MTINAVWNLIVMGSVVGLALRWLLRLKVPLQWAAAAGAAMMVLQPWITMNFGSMSFASLIPSTSLPSLFFGGGVAAALLAAVQTINNH